MLNSTEKDLKVGDHGYARRQPRAEFEEDELQRAEEERPCSVCQHYKVQLEQQQQHTARLQREVRSLAYEFMLKKAHRRHTPAQIRHTASPEYAVSDGRSEKSVTA